MSDDIWLTVVAAMPQRFACAEGMTMHQAVQEAGITPFGRLLRRLRLDRGLTMEELAEASGVSMRAIGDMERGRSARPRRGTVTALAQGMRLEGTAYDGLMAVARAARPAGPGAAPVRVSPCMLPRGVPDFVGREAELSVLRELTRRAATDDRPGTGTQRLPTLPVAVVSGVPGSGKTTLAVRLAEECASSLPDGAFFVDMQGLDERPLTADEAAMRLLSAWGAGDSGGAHHSAEERTALYHATAADLRAVVVLDNARDEAQIRPLLPARGRVLVVVTSRRSLAGLTGVRRLELGSLSERESTALLRAVVDDGRVEEDPAAAGSVTELCGHLPLAVRVAANWAATRSNWSLQRLAARLADEDRRIDALSAGDLRVNSAFSLSYSRLSPETARMFRLLSLVPGGDFSTPLAAVVTGTELLDAEDLLEELLEAGLLMTSRGDRYRFHDLLRLYARSRHRETDHQEHSAQASAGLRTWLLETALAAGQMFGTGDSAPASSRLRHIELTGRDEALAWLKTEGDNWLGAYRQAAGLGEHRAVMATAQAVEEAVGSWISWGHWAEIFELAARSSAMSGDRVSEAASRSTLSWVLWQCDRRHQAAVATAARALALADEAGDLLQQARAHLYLGWLHDAVDDAAPAADSILLAMNLFHEAGELYRYLQAANMNITVLRKMGRTQEAVKTHHMVMHALADPAHHDRLPPNIMTGVISLYHVSYVYLNEGRWEEAAQALSSIRGEQEARGYLRAAAKVYLYLGQALAHLGRDDEAEASYRAVLDLGVLPLPELLEETHASLDALAAGTLPTRTAFE
ncbi:helix-turn-helix domain-containing protein [Streptomyces sp. NPDC048332]|uniref:helix-turn-helix domain-containing protein n=1 Tax=Streptomyces sp. NPDC048332 TaxID=3154619 RepID=UPI003416E2AF